MDFNVHDHNGTWIGIIENPTSAIWTRRYQVPGDFELYLPASAEMLALLADDMYITREDRPEVMLIEHIEIMTDADNGNFLLISGRGVESVLDRRIIWAQTSIAGRVDRGIYKLVNENAISPANAARALPITMAAPNVGKIAIAWEMGTISTANGAENSSTTRCRMKDYIPIGNGVHITLPETLRIHLYYYDATGAYIGYSGWHSVTGYTITPSTRPDAAFVRVILSYQDSATIGLDAAELVSIYPGISAQYTGTNLLETTQEMCKAYGLGFRAVVDDHSIISPRLELLAGIDRSEGQALNSPVIFSAEFENLLSSNYLLDTRNLKNVALVAGEGEGKDRKHATYGSASGMIRRELFVDARDLSTNEGEITDAEYTAQLSGRGAEKIAEHTLTETYDGEIDTSNTYVLDEDYFLGDIVTVENEYGIRKNARVSAIMEAWDIAGYTAIPTFENVEV